jgi:hypothetical protein
MPTGWRPEDREEDDPIPYTDKVNEQVKYTSAASLGMHCWIWIQLIITLILMIYMFQLVGEISFSMILIYGLFLAVSIFAYTSLMDKSRLSIPSEISKFCIGVLLILQLGSWFSIDDILPYGTLIITVYLIVSLFLNFYFLNERMDKI